MSKRDYDQAIADFSEAIRLSPRYRSAYVNRASAWYNQREYDKSIADYDQAILLDPKDFATHFNRALNWNAKGQYEQAIADYTKAIDIDPRSATAYKSRAQAWQKKGMPEKALSDYNRLIELDPAKASGYNGRGLFRQALGEYRAAMADYAKAIELDVDSALAHNNLAWLMATCPDAELRDGARAVEHAREACELTDWKQVSYLDTLAAAYAERGEFKEAVQWQKKVIELADDEDLPGLRDRLLSYQRAEPYRIRGPANSPTHGRP